VEVLLAMAVGGLVLIAASSLLVTIAQAWANRPATRDAFDAHINGVGHFLAAMLEEATLPDGSSGPEVIQLDRPVGQSERDDPQLRFFLREAPPFFFWPHGLASRVHAYFQFEEGEGLHLLWYSELQEMEKNDLGKRELEDEEELFRSLVSPYLDEVKYCYFGEEGESDEEMKDWEEKPTLEEDVESGKFRLPDFIRIIFRWDEEDLERDIFLAIKRHVPSGIEEEPR
jgi:hypothetical protein